MKDDQKTEHRWLRIVVIVTAIALMSGLDLHPLMAQTCNNTSPNTDPTAPCFADNNDILGGQRYMLRDDDLVVNVWAESSSSDSVNDFYLNSSQLDITQGSNNTHALGSCYPGGLSAAQSVVGRVFSLPNDVVVNARPTSDCQGISLFVVDPKDGSNNSSVSLGLNHIDLVAMAMADFDLDGYQDVFVITPTFARIYSAKCTNDPFASCTDPISDGLAAGPQHSVSTDWWASPPVTGDFNGDGIIDVAWPTYASVNGTVNILVKFMSVCPAAGATVLGQSCSQPFQIIESTSSTINTGGVLNLTKASTPRPYIALTANNFDGSVNATTGIADAELLVALENSDSKSATLSLYDFDANMSPTPESTTTLTDLYEDETNTLPLFLVSGQLDWSNPQAVAVFASTKKGGSVEHRGILSVITFDKYPDMTATSVGLDTGDNSNHKTRIYGLAMGRFDPPDTTSSATNSSGTDFDQQIAVLVDHNADTTRLQIFTTPSDPASSSSSYSCGSSDPLCLFTDYKVSSTRYYNSAIAQLVPLQAGDLQGRSLLLGAPEKTTVAQTQPDIILGIPPMHVDFIPPPGGVDPQVINVSVFPSTFNTVYDFSTTTGTQASHQATTSYTTSTKETVESKVSFGVPDVDSVSVKVKDSATQTHQNTVSNTYNKYSSQTYSFTDATVFDDKVAATSLRMNIYSYAVIGQFVCPSDSPNCSDAEKVPLEIQYSGPDNIVHIPASDAKALPWYQPVTEPGNIFSYPGSLSLLEAAGPQQTGTTSSALQLLTPADNEWDSQSSESVKIAWSKGGGSSVSSGSTNTDSYETKVSVSGKASFEGGSASAGASLDVNNSSSFSTLNTSSQTFGASTGVILNRGVGSEGPASSADLLYSGQSFIYGLLEPNGAIQTDLPVNTTVTTHGRIEVGHVADMLSTTPIESGSWWTQVYTAAPDVALNHPQRWLEKEPTSQNTQQVMFNCPIGFTSDFGVPTSDPGSCTSTQTSPTPINVTDAPFYWMKGLFITPGTSTTGPATTLATAGDTVTLQARVYNYSLKNMETDTTVHVRFYAQPWDKATGQFTAGSGKYGFAKAVFIGEDILAPILAFCGGSQGFDSCTDSSAKPNWVLAQVQWDTSTLGTQTSETSWVFWVVVWMEDSSGNLVSEIAQHGLTSIPNQDVDSLAEVPVETYSNNLGFYNQMFTLNPSATTTAQARTVRAGLRQLAAEAFEGFPSAVLRDRTTTLRIRTRALGGQFQYVRAFLYQGDPRTGGKLMDMDIIPVMTEGTPVVVPFRYQPRVCGQQRLFLEVIPSDGGEAAEATFGLGVTLDSIAQTEGLIARLGRLGLGSDTENGLLKILKGAKQSFQSGDQRGGLNQLYAFTAALWTLGDVPSAETNLMSGLVGELGSCLDSAGQ
jgi:hypothetical protein